ncbi:MAG: Bor/Iss family lipoprotein [Bacteriovoracaceae bacterium]
MKSISFILLAGLFAGCTTIHYRSNNSVPVTFTGNPQHRKEVSIEGKKDFWFWGLEPDHQEVFLDEEVRKAGYDGISKTIIYEQKSAKEMLISFITFGLYLPRSYTITGFVSGNTLPEDLEDTAPPTQKP